MEPHKRQRRCVSFEEWGRYIYDLCQSAIGGTCWPEYQPSPVPSVELQRESMGLALAGQLTVVSLRLLTGHFAGSAIGLVVFAVGNRARCSLQASRLSVFLACTFSLAAMDAADLVNNLGAQGLHFLALPFQAHLSWNLNSLSLMMAPVAETCGGFAAWECLSRTGLVFTPGQDLARRTTAAWAPGGWPPAQSWSSHQDYWSSQASTAGAHTVSVAWPEEAWAPAWQEQTNVCQKSDGHQAPWPRKAARTWCGACGADVAERDAWRGSGSFRDEAFCGRCWAAWTRADRIG